MNDDTLLCSATSQRGKYCERAAVPDAPFLICGYHLRRAHHFTSSLLNTLPPEVAAGLYGQSLKATQPKAKRKGIVYYIEVGDRIKIGCTQDLGRRFGAYPPFARPLARELTDGDLYKLERERHQQFASALADGNEWFHPTPQLQAHIRFIRKEYPVRRKVHRYAETY